MKEALERFDLAVAELRTAQKAYDQRRRDCPDCSRPQRRLRVDGWVHLYRLDEPRCPGPPETVPETKARLDRLKRNLGA